MTPTQYVVSQDSSFHLLFDAGSPLNECTLNQCLFPFSFLYLVTRLLYYETGMMTNILQSRRSYDSAELNPRAQTLIHVDPLSDQLLPLPCLMV